SKNIVFAHPSTPVYMRILSPTSQSAGAKVYPVSSTADTDMNAFRAYVRRFGSWNSYPIRNWSTYPPQLNLLWEKFSGTSLFQSEKTNWILRVKERFKYWFFCLLHK
ncbi:MAG: hypothetical protein ACKO7B_18040, partial [Flavobacteriales bacterium]